MLKFLNKKRIDAEWHKVSELEVGMQIAVPRDGVIDAHNAGQINSREWIGDDVLWDEIESIEYVGTEQVWDIEVDGTHNFVGNNIFAHNTYLQGNLGIGTASPTAYLNIKAGTATAGTAPIKLTAGTVNATPETGAIEFDGTDLYFTPSGTTRKKIAYNTDIPITIVNTSSLFSTGLSGTGSGSTAGDSNYFGVDAGYQASGAFSSNFLGYRAGYSSINASYSNFLGYSAGASSSQASDSNFFGALAGYVAESANGSNFFGLQSGREATNASYSNFFGFQAGYKADNASYSNLFGYQVGYSFSGNNLGSNNIIIGKNISLPDGTADAINLGGIIFATGTYSIETGDPSITAVESGKVGIGTTTPNAKLSIAGGTLTTTITPVMDGTVTWNDAGTSHIGYKLNVTDTASDASSLLMDLQVGSASQFKVNKTGILTLSSSAYANTSTDPTDLTVCMTSGGQLTTSAIACTGTSSIRFKNEVNTLTNNLDEVLALRPVSFKYNGSEQDNIGFIAEEVDQIDPRLVVYDKDGVTPYGLRYPQFSALFAGAIQEMDLKVKSINDMELENDWRDNITAWMANGANRITRIFTGEICLTGSDGESECINREELKSLKALLIESSNGGSTPDVPVDTPTEPVILPPAETPVVEPSPEEIPSAEVVPIAEPVVEAVPVVEVVPVAEPVVESVVEPVQ
jgi:hypothetical protein